ncbi:MAG: zinc ribbon domain-containing protein, partial [Endomicrobiia bacterium]|nr:zinc ribbon domain-containing protein [Endomicrobiia bacterium]
MKCPKCGTKNKDTATFCKRCKTRLDIPLQPINRRLHSDAANTEAIWRPDWKWHLKTLAVIYAVLIVGYFAANAMLKTYMRQIPE